MDIRMFRVHKTRRRLILLWSAFLFPILLTAILFALVITNKYLLSTDEFSLFLISILLSIWDNSFCTSSIISTCSSYHISEIIAPSTYLNIILCNSLDLHESCHSIQEDYLMNAKTSSSPSSRMGWSLCGTESQRTDCPAMVWG